MLSNRSIPRATVIPVLAYPDVNQAAAWLCDAFGFSDAHCNRARDHGARITEEPVTHPFGERQYNATDFAGHSWTFSQSVADVHPGEWGGTAEQL